MPAASEIDEITSDMFDAAAKRPHSTNRSSSSTTLRDIALIAVLRGGVRPWRFCDILLVIRLLI